MSKLQVTPQMLDRLKYLLESTDLTSHAISVETGMASSTINHRGKMMGIDMKARYNRIKSKRKGRDKGRMKNPYSKIPDSMTGDGMSLEWLSKKW